MASTFPELAASLQRTAVAIEVGSRSMVDDVLDAVARKVQSNASGRPGPEIVTGAYVDSFSTSVATAGDSVTGTVGTDAPQALRLEYGFVGTDSLGRRYNQPPFPHWRPAAEWAEGKFVKAADTMVNRAVH
jgi:hypothetical protein